MTADKQGPSAPAQCEEAGIRDRTSAVFLAAALRKHLLLHQQMGISRYPFNRELQHFVQPRRRSAQIVSRPRPGPVVAASSLPRETTRQPVLDAPPVSESQADICRDLAGCTGCGLSTARSFQVLGQGNICAGLLIVGDYPGAAAEAGMECIFGREEDELLWKMMRAIGLGPEDVYVTNVVKCRPSGEQVPGPESEQACQDYVHREIALVQPRIILAMGAPATRAVLGTDASVFRLRGRLHPSRFMGRLGTPIPVMVSFHPRFLLEQPAMKKAAWQDLQIVQRQLHAAGGATPVSR